MTFTISQIHLKHSEAAPMASSTHFNKGTSEFYAKYKQCVNVPIHTIFEI